MTLVKDGSAVAKIYAPPVAAPTETAVKKSRKAAPEPPVELAIEDLNYHLEKMSGARLEVVRVDSASAIKGPAIVLGKLAEEAGAKVKPTKYQDAFRILTKGPQLLIAGESDNATANGVYTLLNQLGCEWVMPGKIGEVIPDSKTVSVPDTDLQETPSFPWRSLWYRGSSKLNTAEDLADFAQWKRRQRMGDNALLGDLGSGHVWDQFIKRHQQEFEKDPTMYALVRDMDGNMVRKGPQLESTHPRVVELFVQDIREAFEKNNWPKDKAVAFGIGPADGLGYSVSNESSQAGSGRTDPIVGEPDVTDLLVLLGNQILEQVEKEYPNVSLGYYSYSTHADFPMKYPPHPRLNQIFAPINFSRFHSVFDTNSKTLPYYREVVELWGKQSKEHGNLLSYRGYNWNLAENMAPYSQLRILGEGLPWYRDNGIVAINIEATKAWAVNGPHDFLLAKLMWNCDLPWKQVLKEYCAKSFGKGADAMEKYFQALTDRQHESGHEAGSFHALHLMYDQAFIDSGKALIQKAVAEAKNPDEKTRAGYFLYPLEELELFLKFREAYTRFDFPAASKYYQDILANWQSAYDTNTALVAKEVPQYLKRFLEKFVQQGLQYSTEPNRIVYKIPDQLATMLDPSNTGEHLNYFGPDINDSLFVKTRTWSATWDAQGLAAYRTGAVWYRIPFELPADLKGQPIGLFVGSVEDQVSVWLNGKYVGASPRGFSVPFVFDLTEAAEPGKKNLLALKIRRISAANEIGLGGLIRPAFIFTGPRLEEKVPAAEPQRRVLPGGELGEIEK